MKSYRHSIAVPIGLLLIAAVLVLPWDAKISEWFHQDKFPGDLEKILDLAETFAHGIGIGAIIITLLLIDPTHRRSTLWTALGTGFSGIMANVIKLNVARFRPKSMETLQTQDWTIGWQGPFPWLQGWEGWIDRSLQSFPSGHTAAAAALATCLSQTYPKARWWFAILATLAGLQRIESGAHFPSDVLAGAAVGIACGSFTMRLGKRKRRSSSSSQAS